MTIRAYGISRNGLPQRVNYAYQGTGHDQLTAHVGDEELKALKPDYEQWIPPMPRGTSAQNARQP